MNLQKQTQARKHFVALTVSTMRVTAMTITFAAGLTHADSISTLPTIILG